MCVAKACASCAYADKVCVHTTTIDLDAFCKAKFLCRLFGDCACALS